MKHLALKHKIFLIILVALLFRLYLSAIIPIWQVPDEIAHYAFVEYWAKNNELPVMIPAYAEYFQPPIYYIIQGIILKPFLSSSLNVQVHILRLLSIMFGILTIFMTYKIAGMLFANNDKLILMSTSFVAFLPSFINMNVGITNANMADFVSSVIIFLMVKMFYTNTSYRGYIFIGIMCGIGLLTRLNLIATIGALAIAILLKSKEGRKFNIKKIVKISLIVFGIMLIISSWWYFRNYGLYGDFIGFAAMKMSSPQDDINVNSVFIARLLGWTFVTFWASFGTTNNIFLGNLTSLPGIAIFAGSYLLLLLISIGSISGIYLFYKRYKSNKNILSDGQKKAFIIGVSLLSMLGLLFVSYNLYDFQPQGRYFFSGIPVIAIIFSFGIYNLFNRCNKNKLLGIYLASFILMHIISIVSIMQHYF